MKKTLKTLFVLSAVIVLCGIIAVSVMASGQETQDGPDDGYYFQVYDMVTGTLTKYSDPEKFDDRLANLNNDSIVTLLWNIEEDENSSYLRPGNKATSTNSIKVYLDLNGYYYSYVQHSNSYAFSMHIPDYTEINIYSSRPGGTIYNYSRQTSAKKSGELFRFINNASSGLRGNYATLNLGEISFNTTISYDNLTESGKDSANGTKFTGSTVTNTPVTCSGDNLTTYSAALVSVGSAQNVKVNINGGTYYDSDGGSLISYSSTTSGEAAASFTAKNAKFISASGSILETSETAAGAMSFENCRLYSDAGLFSSDTSSPALALSFKNCYFQGNVGALRDGICLINCKASTGTTFPASVNLARVNEVEEVEIASYNFSYNSDGTVNPASYNNKTVSKTKVTYTWQPLTDASEYATIVWDAEDILGIGEKVTETWLVGETPISPIPIPDATSVYRYAFPGVTEVTADMVGKITTYTLTGYANFGIKANLELSEKFIFNIYIPADIWSSVVSTKINGITATAEETTIYGEEYYLVAHSINADVASDDFTFEIELNGYNGKPFINSYVFSIFDYIDRIQAGNYTEEAKALIDATKNYILAVDNFANGSANEINVTYSPTKTGNISNVTAIKSAQLVLGEAIAFRFNSETRVAMTLVLPCQDGASTSTREVTVSESDWSSVENAYYYDVTLFTKFLNDGITVTVGNQSGTFYLDDYIRWVKENQAQNTNLVTLVNAIGAYSAAAKAYATSPNDQTPVVRFRVGGQEITKIVANSDAAEAAANALKAIIESKNSSASITVIKDTEMNSSYTNAILISLTEPNAAYDYEIKADGTNLVINCSFKSFIDKATEMFINDNIKYAEANVDFAADYKNNYYTAKIYYSDFGAAGNAVNEKAGHNNTDDFEALKATHDFANMTKRHTVYADEGATYYIRETRANGGTGSVQTITVKTDVNWGNATFIIDDTDIGTHDNTKKAGGRIFTIASDYKASSITDAETLQSLARIGENTTRIDLGLGYPALLTVYNSEHKVYRREGYSTEDGLDQHEIILIDENGYVDESTPFMFNYETVTSVTVQRVDEDTTTIRGGTFYTWASKVNLYSTIYADNQAFNPDTGALLYNTDGSPVYSENSGYVRRYKSIQKVNGAHVYTHALSNPDSSVWSDQGIFLQTTHSGYIRRDLNVARSNTIIENVQHYVKYEISLAEQKAGILDEHGATIAYGGQAYYGFFYAQNATDITFKDCVLTGRRCYKKVKSTTGADGTTGTYDFGADAANNLRLEGCIQSNFYLVADSDMSETTTYKEVNSDGSITFGIEVETNSGKEKLPTFKVTKDAEGIPTVTEEENAVLSMASILIGGKASPITQRICWGIGGTNWCKNLQYVNSVMSRFDAHCGLLSGKVIGSTVNAISLVGKGEFLLEDTTWIAPADNANSLISLRSDYGSPWEGTITIKDTKAVGYAESTATYLISHRYQNWDFGYICHFPNIVVDNLEFTNTDTVTFLSANWTDGIHKETYNGQTNVNVVVPPEFIRIINNKENYIMPEGTEFFSNTLIEISADGGDQSPEEEQNGIRVEDSPIVSITPEETDSVITKLEDSPIALIPNEETTSTENDEGN